MSGYFQKTTSAGSAIPKIKHTSDYASLQAAFNDLVSGDTLLINNDHILTSTVNLITSTNNLNGDINIIGMGGQIRPNTNNNPSVLMKIENNATAVYPTNFNISGLRFHNPASTGSGLGTALEIVDGRTPGGMFHIKLDSLKINNFTTGLEIKNAFDIYIENILVTQCSTGIKCNTTITNKLTGQIKLFGGMSMNNTNHIQLTAISGESVDHIDLFGYSCGHQRNNASGNAVGIQIDCSTAGVFIFGSHFEDLSKAINIGGNFVGTSTMVGCKLVSIQDSGLDFASGSARTMTVLGNTFSPNNKAFIKAPNPPYLDQGFAALGNTRSQNNVYPNIGILEAYSATGKSAFRLATYLATNRPTASTLPIGTVIFNTETNKINIVNNDGDKWVNADGTLA